MKRFILEQSETEFYTSHSGLALVGLCLNRYGQLNQALDKGIPLRHGISHADMIKSSIGTLCLGKSDFEAIENHRNDDYFKAALSIQQVPSSARLRQRLDEHAEALIYARLSKQHRFSGPRPGAGDAVSHRPCRAGH